MIQQTSRFSWKVLGILILSCVLLWGQMEPPAWAIQLGDHLPTVHQKNQQNRSVRLLEQETSTERVTALANEKGEVFEVRLTSHAKTPPLATEYLGPYSTCSHETVNRIPLRGKVVRYTCAQNQQAVWSVYGLTGSFSAQALSLDKAPSTQGSRR
jgi:hypothetical protein